MREIAKEKTSNLEALFTNTSKKTGLSPAIIEKDFWVCWLLDYLFHDSPWSDHLAFKGGTSLSKAFNLIKRFSEDIDLILDWRLLGYDRDEPWLTRSNTQQDIFNEKANARSADFLKSEFAPRLKLDLSYELGKEVDIGIDEHDHEGRVITAEFDNCFVVTCYTPNSQSELKRLDYRMKWEDDFKAYLKKLEEKKPVIMCGDLNVAHKEIDLKNPKTNRKNAGFTDEERSKMTALLDDGFIDTYRYFYPDTEGVYSWWSYRFKAREKNAGWRIDYFIVSKALESKLDGAKIHTEILGSDHCPVELTIDI